MNKANSSSKDTSQRPPTAYLSPRVSIASRVSFFVNAKVSRLKIHTATICNLSFNCTALRNVLMTLPSRRFFFEESVSVQVGCCYLGQLLAQHLHSQECEVPAINILKSKTSGVPDQWGGGSVIGRDGYKSS